MTAGCANPPQKHSEPAVRTAESKPIEHPTTRRSAVEVEQELLEVHSKLGELFRTTDDYFDKAKRDAAAPEAIPALRRLLALVRELANTPEFGGGPDASDEERLFFVSLLCVLGDPDSLAILEKHANSDDPYRKAAAARVDVMMKWFRAGRAPGTRRAVVETLAQRAKEFRESGSMNAAAYIIAATSLPDETRLRTRVRQIWTEQFGNEGEHLDAAFRNADAKRNKTPFSG